VQQTLHELGPVAAAMVVLEEAHLDPEAFLSLAQVCLSHAHVRVSAHVHPKAILDVHLEQLFHYFFAA